jgi:nucleoside-triphosphatase THEP1
MVDTFEINSSDVKVITNYVYKNRANLEPFDKASYFVCDVMTKKTITNNIQYITLGYGNYNYNHTCSNGTSDVIHIKYNEEGKPVGTSCTPQYFDRLIIETTHNVFVDFYEKACSEDTLLQNRTNILVCDKHGDWTVYNKIPKRTLKTIYIDETIKSKILDDVTHFLKPSIEDEYNAFGIPYKKIYLLTGSPGSGKTSLIKALCNEINYNLGMLTITKETTNTTLLTAFKYIDPKSVILIEDIDCLFNKRHATNDNAQITFSNLINIMDGVLTKSGTIIFITTNHPELLDNALLRPGRIDMILQINLPKKDEIKKLFTDLMSRYINEDTIETDFNKFYDIISKRKLSMSAIVNFLFTYKDKYMDNISELIDTNTFIINTMKDEACYSMYG